MNLLGIVKHALNTEVLYFGPTFGREWLTPEELVRADEADPQAGWYATEQETAAGLVDLYRRVQLTRATHSHAAGRALRQCVGRGPARLSPTSPTPREPSATAHQPRSSGLGCRV